MKAKLTYLSLETIFYWTNILGMICGAFLILFAKEFEFPLSDEVKNILYTT